MRCLLTALTLALGLATGPALAENYIRTDLGELLEEGQVVMSPYRHSSDPDEIGMCMDLMEHNQATVDLVREQIQLQPSSDYMAHLSMAAVDIRHCVSCSLNAEESCETAAELLAEADEIQSD